MKITEADAYLIDHLAQPASDYVHDWTGTDCVMQALWLYRLTCLVMITQFITGERGMTTLLLSIVLIIYIEMSLPLRRAMIRRNTLNPLRETARPVRILGWFFILIDICMHMSLLDYAFWTAWSATLYLEACTPRPRKPRKLPRLSFSSMLPLASHCEASTRVRPTSSRDQKQAAVS